jgi:hypothetical protein
MHWPLPKTRRSFEEPCRRCGRLSTLWEWLRRVSQAASDTDTESYQIQSPSLDSVFVSVSVSVSVYVLQYCWHSHGHGGRVLVWKIISNKCLQSCCLCAACQNLCIRAGSVSRVHVARRHCEGFQAKTVLLWKTNRHCCATHRVHQYPHPIRPFSLAHSLAHTAYPGSNKLVVFEYLLQDMCHEWLLVLLETDLTKALENTRNSQVVVERHVQMSVAVTIVCSTTNSAS